MTITSQQIDAWDAEVDAAYAAGRQEGMKQERALWELSRLGQEIEAQPEEQQSCDKQGASLKMQDIVCPNCGDMARTWPKQERPWVSLTREEINSALSKYASWYDFAAHLENILKEKNQ